MIYLNFYLNLICNYVRKNNFLSALIKKRHFLKANYTGIVNDT